MSRKTAAELINQELNRQGADRNVHSAISAVYRNSSQYPLAELYEAYGNTTPDWRIMKAPNQTNRSM